MVNRNSDGVPTNSRTQLRSIAAAAVLKSVSLGAQVGVGVGVGVLVAVLVGVSVGVGVGVPVNVSTGVSTGVPVGAGIVSNTGGSGFDFVGFGTGAIVGETVPGLGGGVAVATVGTVPVAPGDTTTTIPGGVIVAPSGGVELGIGVGVRQKLSATMMFLESSQHWSTPRLSVKSARPFAVSTAPRGHWQQRMFSWFLGAAGSSGQAGVAVSIGLGVFVASPTTGSFSSVTVVSELSSVRVSEVSIPRAGRVEAIMQATVASAPSNRRSNRRCRML